MNYMLDKIILNLKEHFSSSFDFLPKFSDLSLLIAIILSIRTRDNNVIKYCYNFLKNINDINYLSALTLDIIYLEIKSINFYKTKGICILWLVRKFLNNNWIIYSLWWLLKIKGIGQKTAFVFLNIVTNQIYIGVDVHVRRMTILMFGNKFRNDTEIQNFYIKNTSKSLQKDISNLLVHLGKAWLSDKNILSKIFNTTMPMNLCTLK